MWAGCGVIGECLSGIRGAWPQKKVNRLALAGKTLYIFLCVEFTGAPYFLSD